MIFKEPHLIPEHKWQTRRPVKPGDKGIGYDGDILCVYRNNRLLWQVGKTYAKQPGRGQKAVGRTPPIKEIRREKLSEITPADCIAEGIEAHLVLFDHEYYRIGSKIPFGTARLAFKDLWNSLYPKAYRWEDFPLETPDVWVLEFERVGEVGEE